MASTALIQTPAPLSLSGNPINFKIAGKDAFSDAPGGFSCNLTKGGNFVEDQQLILTWAAGTKNVTLTAKDTADADNEIWTGATNVNICDALNSNAHFVEDFLCYIADSGLIAIAARNFGTLYNITKTGALPVTINNVQNATNSALTSFYKVIVKVERDNKITTKHALPVVFDAAEEENLPVDWNINTTGFAEVDLASVLKEEFRGHYTLHWNTDEFLKVQDIIKTFRIYAYSQSQIPDQEGSGLYSSVLRVLQGKLETFRQGELNYLQKTFYNLLAESQMFLSFAPTTKLTDIYAPERLYYCFLTAGTYRYYVEETYTDGTSASALLAQFTAAAYQVTEFDTSYKGIRINTEKKLQSYKVWLTDTANNAVSEERIFIVDYTYHNSARYFLFINSLGVYECLRVTGRAVKNQSVDKDFVNIPFDKLFSNLDRMERQVSSDTELSYEMNSGWFYDKYWADYFVQFLQSRDVYWLKKGTAYPVSIRESKNKVSEDGEYTQQQSFILIHSIHDDFTESFISTEPISVGDFNFDFNTDFFIGDANIIFEPQIIENFENWSGGLPVGWTQSGAGTVAETSEGVSLTSPAGADLALFYKTSFLTRQLYRLSVTIESISNQSALFIRAGAFDSPLISAPGTYTYQFEFESFYTGYNSLQMHFFSPYGQSNVNIVISNLTIEYEYIDLTATELEETFNYWLPYGDLILPQNWSAYGVFDEENTITDETGKLRITLDDSHAGAYSLQHNFKINAGETYRVTIDLDELTDMQIRFYVGLVLVQAILDDGQTIFEFTPTDDYYGFDLWFQRIGTNHTALISYFKIEQL